MKGRLRLREVCVWCDADLGVSYVEDDGLRCGLRRGEPQIVASCCASCNVVHYATTETEEDMRRTHGEKLQVGSRGRDALGEAAETYVSNAEQIRATKELK